MKLLATESASRIQRLKGRQLFFATLFFGIQSCASVPRGADSVQHRTHVVGKLHVFEDSYFESRNGKIYDLKIQSLDDQKTIENLSRRDIDRSEICISLSLIGMIEQGIESDYRHVFVVQRVLSSQRTTC